MGEIRPFTEEHVLEVANLHPKTIKGRKEQASQALQDRFREIFLRNPWVSPEIPSLVYLDGGKLVGFLGIVPRDMEYRGKRIRMAVTSQFMVDREAHRGNAGLELMRRCFAGPQDLTYTNGNSEGASVVWTAAGALPARIQSFNWARILRPARIAQKSTNSHRVLGAVVGIAARVGDRLLPRLPVAALRPPKSPYSYSQVAADEFLTQMQQAGSREPLKPVYEGSSFRWLISVAASAPGVGPLRLLTISGSDGQVCGWCAYHAKADGPGYILHIAARRRDQFNGVLLAVFEDAWKHGCADVRGQAVPQFLTNLTANHCLFREVDTCAILHSRDRELLNDIRTGDANLSRLDGNSWMGFIGY